MTYTCASCHVCSCEEKEKDLTKVPKNCPMLNKEYVSEIFDAYKDPEVSRFYIASKTYRQPNTTPTFVPRLRSVIDFCKTMGYKKIGLAFCAGFRKEAELYAKILRGHGLEVVSVCCSNCGFNISDFGVPLEEGEFDAACNPLGQAYLMNEENVEFNLVMGLCTGHDSLFMKNANAMSTVILVKDPSTGHSPLASLHLYEQYDVYKNIFDAPSAGEGKNKKEEK